MSEQQKIKEKHRFRVRFRSNIKKPLERKRKRRRFQPVALFPICVFILQWQQWRQMSKKKSLSRSLWCEGTFSVTVWERTSVAGVVDGDRSWVRWILVELLRGPVLGIHPLLRVHRLRLHRVVPGHGLRVVVPARRGDVHAAPVGPHRGAGLRWLVHERHVVVHRHVVVDGDGDGLVDGRGDGRLLLQPFLVLPTNTE